jgi:hypothetical protein
MTDKSDNTPNPRRRTTLHASVRFVVALILQLWMMYYFTHAGAVGGVDTASDKLKEFLFVFVPTITILFLLPVIIRGSFSLKFIAIVLSLFPAWMAFNGWTAVIDRLFR